MRTKYRLACFDMDGTIIRNTDSVRYLCEINGMSEQFMAVESLESAGLLSWIEADFLKAPLIKGLLVEEVKHQFSKNVSLISGADFVVDFLIQHGIESILITSGPEQVAHIVGDKVGIKKIFASKYRVIDGYFNGEIIKHLGQDGKLECVRSYCNDYNIDLNECIAIGDGSSDIDVFKAVGKSIAVNYSTSLKEYASVCLKTDNLKDILPFIE